MSDTTYSASIQILLLRNKKLFLNQDKNVVAFRTQTFLNQETRFSVCQTKGRHSTFFLLPLDTMESSNYLLIEYSADEVGIQEVVQTCSHIFQIVMSFC